MTTFRPAPLLRSPKCSTTRPCGPPRLLLPSRSRKLHLPAPKKPKKEKDPVVKLAAMPEVKAPAKKSEDAPVAQQPVMRLPQDAIRGAREGSSAPLEQFTKSTERKRKSDKKKTEEVIAGPPPETTERGPRRRGGKDRRDVREGDDRDRDKGLAGMSGSRAARQDSRRRRSITDDDLPAHRRLRRRSKGASTAAPRKGKVALTLPCSVRSFSEATGLASSEIQRTLMGLGSMVTINAELDRETAEMLAQEFEVELEFREQETVEDKLITPHDASRRRPRLAGGASAGCYLPGPRRPR